MPAPLPLLRLAAALAVLAVPLYACSSAEETLAPLKAGTTAGSVGAGGTGGAGGSGTGGAGSGGHPGAGGAAFVPAAHTAFPALLPHSGTIYKHPKLVTITFPGYAHRQEVEAFGDYVVTSPWLAAAGAEYGVGPGAHLAKVVLPDAPPAMADDAALLTLLAQRIQDGTLPAGDVATEVLYMLYVPSSTTVMNSGTLCTEFVGYHSDGMAGSAHIAYAVVGDCDGPITDTTSTAAHELIEASTDTYDGYYLDPAVDDPWSILGNSEDGDLCQYLPDFYQGGYAMQRSWSNAAAAAGASPCVPIPKGDIYYNVSASPAKIPVVDAGGKATFTLTGWSTQPLDDWEVKVDASTTLDFKPTWKLGANAINNGAQVTLELGVPAGTPSGQVGGILVDSGSGSGRFWPVAVMVK